MWDRIYGWLDGRFDLDDGSEFLGKAFPAEDSFLLGEVALFTFFVLVLTGVFLGFFFEPSTTEVTYEGSVAQYQGQDLPAAFVSVLHITYDIPYGMFLRRMHHWAAHFFVASIGLHLLRVFFTGAYRNPRELNWIVGGLLAVLAIFAAYTGYSLPFDEFASTATGIGYSIAKSVPVFGDVLSKIVFGGQYPSSATVPRFYFLHVFAIPVAIMGLIGVHMAILIRQKHTEAPRSDDVAGELTIDRGDDTYVVGLPAFPNQTAVSVVVFFLTLASVSLLAGFLPVHNVAEYGPNDPASTPGLIMPDWFLMWVFGFLKLMPSWTSFTVPFTDIHVSTEFLSGIVLPGIVFGAMFLWPFIDYREEPTHFTVDPMRRPWQTAVGVAGVTFIMVASLAGMNNILAEVVHTPTGTINTILLASVLLYPLVAGGITYVVLRGNDSAAGPGREEAAADGGSSVAADDPPVNEETDSPQGGRSDDARGGGPDD
ncbi:cytochrome b [Halomicrococcus sp. SG-WS-1]|uniref:cytochrome b n=1 Tax=Halomicrococcus sp. SG-WS-1 TaxID=3439057 RepID=UPI003F7B1614